MDLMYMHDDSENMEDSFMLQLTDGRHKLHRQVMVKVLPVNDEEPHIIRYTQYVSIYSETLPTCSNDIA